MFVVHKLLASVLAFGCLGASVAAGMTPVALGNFAWNRAMVQDLRSQTWKKARNREAALPAVPGGHGSELEEAGRCRAQD